jgi:hypothetical protein
LRQRPRLRSPLDQSAGQRSGRLFNFAHNMGRAMSLGVLGAPLVLTEASSYETILSVRPLARSWLQR